MSTETSTLLDIVYPCWKAGVTILPHVAGEEAPSYLDANGSRAAIAWGRYKTNPPDMETLERWFRHGTLDTVRLEILTGSHPVEKYEAPAPIQILDFESVTVFEAFLETM